ncbi:MAG: PH domain-containing protein [Moorea sp. SIO1F2]|uniref:PH domain-containing protein n=1 Tax=unclassified Moorena TaxID=2683338 RepID=UPI0013B7920A|nr:MULTISPECIES: PH domain-containing protein [unclassified Moorena]NEN95303.1 PH domain-containing protein [Moorena sp. SIO3I7]NEO59788.1 PH domain-containing protein [Moorena sp. SIO4G2]NEP47714.1 PH domain-containing protein [Moorena sp. SIO3C2]NEO04090.1 PH domain-containing protein [Moorena sp. SIO3I8]NEO15509.1 PH domain-containing protein [Moorena sp. SIO3E8]
MGIREDVFYEGGPHRGDLIISILLAFTIIFIPLTVAAIVRALWLRYRITSRRISITGGWRGRDRSDVIYSEISKIATVPRGIGTWGDIVVTLKDGSRLEMRAIPRFREIYDYIAERAADKTGKAVSAIKMM